MERGPAHTTLIDQQCRRIAVVRLQSGLGDMLCAVPALRALRAALPESTITLAGLHDAAWFIERFPELVDEWLEIPYWPGLAEGEPSATLDAVHAARRVGFDAAIQLHGTGNHVNDLALSLGARVTAGFHAHDEEAPGPEFFPWPEEGHESHRLSHLLHALGCPWPTDEIAFPERPDDIEAALPILDRVCGRPFAVVHPGASRTDRRWTVEGFARVAAGIAGRGMGVLVTGTEAERPLANEIVRLCPEAVNAVGATSLGSLAVLLKRADLTLTNDTGAAHLAAAAGSASVVVFTATDPRRWAPIDRDRHRVVDLRDTPAIDLLQQVRVVERAVTEVLDGE